VLAFYDRFAERNATHAGLQKEAAKAYVRVAEIYLRLGELAKGSAACGRALAIFEALEAEGLAGPDQRYARAEAHLLQERLSRGAGDLGAAERHLRRAVAGHEALTADFPEASKYRSALARAYARLGGHLEKQRQPREAEAAYRRSLALWKKDGPAPASPFAVLDAATTRHSLAVLVLEAGRPAEARSLLKESIAELRHSSRFPPATHLLAAHYKALAAALTRLGETTLAAEASRKAEQSGRGGRFGFGAGAGPGRRPPGPR
jgi:tetratricopeptide (TPR) repeat protein